MSKFDFTAFAAEVHKNAVEKGWWETDRPDHEIAMLIISELAEALEEFRKHMPMVYRLCNEPDQHKGKICEFETDCYMRKVGCMPEHCHKRDKKPEGIAVELIDAVLRILDVCGKAGADLSKVCARTEFCLANLQYLEPKDDLTAFEFALCKNVLIACEVGISKPMGAAMLFDVVATPIFAWIAGEGIDPYKLLLDKHEYNKSRAYRHGDKAI